MRHDVEDDGDRVIEDGESVRCPIFLKDHRPHFLRVTDEGVRDARREARRARQSWIRDMTSAWKRTLCRDAGPEPDAAEALLKRHLRTEPDDDAARRDRAYVDYCARVSQAWQQTNPAARANSVERQRRQWTAER
jgi:hypothetical protein